MSQIDWLSTRDVIKALLSEVEGVAIVHSFPRIEPARQPTRWKTLMQNDVGYNAWTVFRESVIPRYEVSKKVNITHNVLLLGMLSHNDEEATQDTFDELCDRILEKFFNNYRIREDVDLQGPAILRVNEFRQVDRTEVHYAEIATTVQQRYRVV